MASYVEENGKKFLKFSNSLSRQFVAGAKVSSEGNLRIPCGQCIGCRLERSRQWAVRCMHEAKMHERNCFLTLTYSPEKLPEGGTLVKKHFQDFMKRLRRKFVPVMPGGLSSVDSERWNFHHGIRFYHCGEYGENGERPHYHAILFNFFPEDAVFHSMSGDNKLFVSPILEELWSHGFVTIGEVTFDSAAYVARYCTKKVTGSDAVEHYRGRLPEYATMSRRPGIGKAWFDKFKGDCYPSDLMILPTANGIKKGKPPRYYDSKYAEEHPDLFEDLKETRLKVALEKSDDSSSRRLVDRLFCLKARLHRLFRPLENV
jgi:hypothetical protein